MGALYEHKFQTVYGLHGVLLSCVCVLCACGKCQQFVVRILSCLYSS
jgi:hypothetical protein